MTDLLAQIRKQLSGGFTISGELQSPVQRFHVTALFGPSGSGKTTWLRILAGLEQPDHGLIRFGSEIWFDSQNGICLSPQRRGIGFLFQSYALFPHLSVAENIAFGLQAWPRKERQRRVQEMLALVQLEEKQREYPHRLSGGEQQRLALARALAPRPRLLLLDEPFSALDAHLRRSFWRRWRTLLEPFATSVILVSHDREEVLTLAHQVAILVNGKVCQIGSVEDVFNRPCDETVARLVGIETVLAGRFLACLGDTVELQLGHTRILAALPEDTSALSPSSMTPGQEVLVCIRGEDVLLARDTVPLADISARNILPARLLSIESSDHILRVHLDAGFPLTATVTRAAAQSLGLSVGQSLAAIIKASSIHIVPR